MGLWTHRYRVLIAPGGSPFLFKTGQMSEKILKAISLGRFY